MRIARTSILVLFLASLMTGCKTLINKLAFHPDSINVISENHLPQGIQHITVTTEDGVTIESLYLPSVGSNKVLIYFHGNAGNIYHRIPGLMLLQKLGVNVIGVSYRGYGKSTGKPSEAGVYQDGKAVFKYVTEELGFAKTSVIILGRSIGSTVAVNTAQHKDIAGLILVTPLTNAKEQAKVGGLRFLSPLAGDAFDNLTKIKNVNAPLLVVHGTQDGIIPISMGRKLFEAATAKKKFVAVEGAGHNNLQDVYGQAYWPPIFDFITQL
ncbi:alpha/beta hydrolase [Pseudomonadota bacterium]